VVNRERGNQKKGEHLWELTFLVSLFVSQVGQSEEEKRRLQKEEEKEGERTITILLAFLYLQT